MANQLNVQAREAIMNLSRLGWSLRRIARELKLSRNTVRNYVRSVDADALAEQVLQSAKGTGGGRDVQTDPLSTAGSEPHPVQTDPLSTTGNSGRKSLCLDYQDLILAGFESGLTAQRIYRMSNATQHA